ncbi:MAG: hypothetical protein Q9213_000330 [Squamulea squamosa]
MPSWSLIGLICLFSSVLAIPSPHLPPWSPLNTSPAMIQPQTQPNLTMEPSLSAFPRPLPQYFFYTVPHTKLTIKFKMIMVISYGKLADIAEVLRLATEDAVRFYARQQVMPKIQYTWASHNILLEVTPEGGDVMHPIAMTWAQWYHFLLAFRAFAVEYPRQLFAFELYVENEDGSEYYLGMGTLGAIAPGRIGSSSK